MNKNEKRYCLVRNQANLTRWEKERLANTTTGVEFDAVVDEIITANEQFLNDLAAHAGETGVEVSSDDAEVDNGPSEA